jgi:hypothetical protein
VFFARINVEGLDRAYKDVILLGIFKVFNKIKHFELFTLL